MARSRTTTAAAALAAVVVTTALTGCDASAPDNTERHRHQTHQSDQRDRAQAQPSRASAPPLPLEPSAPTGPAAAADLLVRAERAIADPDTTGEALTRAARSEQVAYRAWSRTPAWDAAVRSRLPASLRRVADDNLAARRALRSIYPTSVADLPTTLPAWRIDPPTPAPTLLAAYHRAERLTGVGWAWLAAINFVESDFGRIRGLSDAGAQGPMQFIPATWATYGAGGDIDDPRDAVLGAGRLLAANGFARDPHAALLHYNNSEGYARAVALLAGLMERRPRAFAAYHEWRVYYLTRRGPVLLPQGYDEPRPVPVERWLRDHPGALGG